MHYSVEPRNRIFAKDNGFLSFTKNMDKNTDKTLSKNLSSKHSQKLFDHGKTSATEAFKSPSKAAIQKPSEATVDSVGNKITDKAKKVSKNSQHRNSETVTNENYKEIPKKRKLPPEESREIIDDLRYNII